MSKKLGSVSYIHPKTGKVLFRDKMPMKELKKLVSEEEWEKERVRRYLEKKKYRERNRDKILAKKKEYREKNKVKILESSRDYYQRNREECVKRTINWAKENPDKRKTNKKNINYLGGLSFTTVSQQTMLS